MTRLKHPALMQASGWRYRERMRDLEAAHRWGCPSPSYFDALPKDEKLDIIAWYEARWRMDAVDAWEAQMRAEAAGRRRLRKR